MKYFISIIIFLNITFYALSQNNSKSYFSFHSKTNTNLSLFPRNNFYIIKPKSTALYQSLNLHLPLMSTHYIALYDYSTNNYSFYFSPLYTINFDNRNIRPYSPYRLYTSIDSFNPYGVSNVQDALLLGFINYILDN